MTRDTCKRLRDSSASFTNSMRSIEACTTRKSAHVEKLPWSCSFEQEQNIMQYVNRGSRTMQAGIAQKASKMLLCSETNARPGKIAPMIYKRVEECPIMLPETRLAFEQDRPSQADSFDRRLREHRRVFAWSHVGTCTCRDARRQCEVIHMHLGLPHVDPARPIAVITQFYLPNTLSLLCPV